MIAVVGEAPKSTRYFSVTFEYFQQWILKQFVYQLDIETTVTEWWCDKEMITMQFGDRAGKNQLVLHWLSLASEQKAWVKEFLQDNTRQKMIHNGMFEYVVLRFHDIIIENIYDTMLVEKILFGGQAMEKGFYALGGNTTANGFFTPGLANRYLGEQLDKSQQTTFGFDPLTEEQVVYAADDVRVLAGIRDAQEADERFNPQVAELEFEALLSYGDMTYNGMPLEVNEWLANLDLVEPIITAAEQDLYKQMLEDPILYRKAVELKYIYLEDECTINWASSADKIKLVQLVCPELSSSAKAGLKKFMKDNPEHENLGWLEAFYEGNYEDLQKNFITHMRDELVAADLITPAGHTYLNWNSQVQVLPLFQAVDKKLKGLAEEDLGRFPHPIGAKLKEYKESLKLRTTYGESFVTKYVEPDGRVRTSYNQIVSTGRVSSSNPNLQNIPSKESVGNRYRNPFSPPPGMIFVDADYNSQELMVIAYLSKDPVWLEAIAKNQDIHSVCAQMVFPEKWQAGTEEGCDFFKVNEQGEPAKQKCNCKKHKYLRSDVKPVSFGLAYGLTEYKLSGDLSITVKAAKAIIDAYFSAFPRIKSLLDWLGNFGVENGFIQTIKPYFRKRYFPEWYDVSDLAKQMHQAGVQHDYKLGEIERASKNMPVQGCSSEMVKLSACNIRKFLWDNGLQDKILQAVHVHDQISCYCVKELAEWWRVELKRIMEESAKVIIPTGIVTADSQITERWSK